MTDIEHTERYRLYKTSVSHPLEIIKTKIATKIHLNNTVPPLEQLLLTLKFLYTVDDQTSITDNVDD